jgi:hypothetical protein
VEEAHLAISVRAIPRRSSLPNIVVAATILAAVFAVLPIVAAIGVQVFHGTSPRTAFATSPSGDYGVAAQSEEAVDRIFIVPASNPSGAFQVATIQHLPGFTARGAVSPDGKRLALVVAEAGTPTRPLASLLVLSLESGEVSRVALNLDLLQRPLWRPDGQAIVVSRTTVEEGASIARLFNVDAAGRTGETVVFEHWSVLAVYAIGFGVDGELVTVVLDGRGSTLMASGAVIPLSAYITRDWQLSPDRNEIAFIESNTGAGLKYFARTVSLREPTIGHVTAQALTANSTGQQLGIAWRPGAAGPTTGDEPSPGSSVTAANASTAAGFDVPLAYSRGGNFLAVQRWSGAGFENAGSVQLQFVGDDGRQPLSGFTEFFGWASR